MRSTNGDTPHAFLHEVLGHSPNAIEPPQQASDYAGVTQPTSASCFASHPGRTDGFDHVPETETFDPFRSNASASVMSTCSPLANGSVRPTYNGFYGSTQLGPDTSVGPTSPDMDPYLRKLLDGATYASRSQSRDDSVSSGKSALRPQSRENLAFEDKSAFHLRSCGGSAFKSKVAPAQQRSQLPPRPPHLPPKPVTEPMKTSASISGLSTQDLSAV